MIFGAVKSGKSSLGNFIAGKNFLEANFDNAYKHLGPTKFGTIDVKRSTGGLQTDDKGNQWFSEGVLDTTGNIQFFTLAGMRWIDSPGTGAIAKDTDKQDGRTMDQMVKEYIPYTDMCIFLQNSGEPGLQEDMQFIKLLDKENQTALVVISHRAVRARAPYTSSPASEIENFADSTTLDVVFTASWKRSKSFISI